MADTITVWDNAWIDSPHRDIRSFPPIPKDCPILDSEYMDDEEATFLHFEVNGIGPVAGIVYDDEPEWVFTTDDWQSTQPESIDDIPDYIWFCYAPMGSCRCVNLSGLPRIIDFAWSNPHWDGNKRLSEADYSDDPQILDALAHDNDFVVREAVAQNDHAMPGTLLYLATLTDHGYSKESFAVLREAIAANPQCGLAARECLIYDEDDDVRLTLAQNPKAPIFEVLVPLANDEDTHVREAATLNLNRIMQNEFDHEHSTTCAMSLAALPTAPAETLAMVHGFADKSVDRNLAYNSATPAAILEDIAKVSNDPTILEGIANNPSTPSRILGDFIESCPDKMVVNAAKRSLDARENGAVSPSQRATQAKRVAGEFTVDVPIDSPRPKHL